MLRKSQRLSRTQFNTVRSSLLVITSKYVSLRFVCSKQNSRFSVVVPKSVERLAVDRNTLKRRIYGFLEHYPQKVTGIIYVRSKSSTYAGLTSCMQEVLSEATKHCDGF